MRLVDLNKKHACIGKPKRLLAGQDAVDMHQQVVLGAFCVTLSLSPSLRMEPTLVMRS